MKVKRVIINRMTDWYTVIDVKSDPFYLSMMILEKLSTRLKRGMIYDRIDMTFTVLHQRNAEIIGILDKAIVILVSRNLITINQTKNMQKNLMITELGLAVLSKYREELLHENK